jgi:uncharacterized protein
VPVLSEEPLMAWILKSIWSTALFGLAVSAQAVTFDCAKANGADENKICSEVALSKLDDEFANSLKLVNANVSLPMRDYLKRSQDAWAASSASPRNGACKGDAACITTKYRERMAYLRNPHLPFEGVYLAKKTRFVLESFASGALRYGFYPEGEGAAVPTGGGAAVPTGGGAALYFNEGKEPRVANRELIPPPPAENCALRLEFTAEGGMNAYVKEAKKKACDPFKGLAGAYVRDYAQMPKN